MTKDKNFWDTLQKLVDDSEIHIDRPKDSAHPRYPEYIYPYDYGELVGTQSQDGAGIDCWVGSGSNKRVTGIIVIIDPLKKDSEIKVLIDCAKDEMKEILPYQNRGDMAGVLHERLGESQNHFIDWSYIKHGVSIKKIANDLYVHAGEVWWVNWGKNIGFEQDGKGVEYMRPVVVVKVLSHDTFLAAPLTTSDHKHPLRVPVSDFGGKDSRAIISQIRTIDKHRLASLVGNVNKASLNKIKKTTRNILW